VAQAMAADGLVHVLCRTNHEVALVRDELEYRGVRAVAASPKFDRYSGEPWAGLFLACRYAMDPGCEWLRSVVGMDKVDAEDCLETMAAGDLLKRWWPLDGLEDDPLLSLTIPRYVAWYQRRDLDDLLPGDGEAEVVVMTVHSAKGLEFDQVVLCDVGRKLGGDDDREEKNLLYVAVTRARDRLALVGDPAEVARLVGE